MSIIFNRGVMFNQKLKLSLIDDYIKLLKIDKALIEMNGYNGIDCVQVNEKLKNSYENLLFKYGLMDISLLVLKKEILDCIKNLSLDLKDIVKMQEDIKISLLYKIKKLKLNDVEFRFLTKNLNVKNC